MCILRLTNQNLLPSLNKFSPSREMPKHFCFPFTSTHAAGSRQQNTRIYRNMITQFYKIIFAKIKKKREINFVVVKYSNAQLWMFHHMKYFSKYLIRKVIQYKLTWVTIRFVKLECCFFMLIKLKLLQIGVCIDMSDIFL